MPRAGGNIAEQVKYAYQDHDTDLISELPPVQNTWYEVFHAQDVRLLYCVIEQTNTDTVAKDVEVRWTIDGNVYFLLRNLPNATLEWVYRDRLESLLGTQGLDNSATELNAVWHSDKRGLDFKVEIRMISVPGTNQTLGCWCVRETLEET